MERAEYEVMAAVEDRHWWYGGMRAIAGAMIERAYGAPCAMRILDAGSGTGGNALFLRRYGTVTAVDYAADALHYGGARLGAAGRASVMALPFADGSFDLVTSFDVLYHRGVSDETVALEETARVLGRHGRLLIRLPAYEFLRSKHDRAVHTRRRYTAGDVAALLAGAGFSIEQHSYVNTLLFPIPLAQRLIERAIPRLEQQESDLALPSGPVNELLRWPLALEAAWLAHGGRLPFGLSIMCLAHKQ